jgi:hypothetical protein
MDRCDWQPFLKAVFERNPVTIKVFGELNLREVYDQLCNWPDESIYDGNRLALPDEVVNFQRGDGFEKALALMHVITSHQREYHIHQNFNEIIVVTGEDRFVFHTTKNLKFPGKESFPHRP